MLDVLQLAAERRDEEMENILYKIDSRLKPLSPVMDIPNELKEAWLRVRVLESLLDKSKPYVGIVTQGEDVLTTKAETLYHAIEVVLGTKGAV